MSSFLFDLLVTAAASVFIWGLFAKQGYLKLPFLFSSVYLGWVIPQLWSLRQYTTLIDSLDDLYIQSLLCLGATVIGWQIGTKYWIRPARSSNEGELRSLELASLALTVFVLILVTAISSFSATDLNSSAWSGPLTILYFFSSLKIASLYMSVAVLLRRRSNLAMWLVAINVGIYVPAVLIFFRRRAMAEAVVAVVFAFWAHRGVSFPRWMVVSGVIAGSLVVFAIGDIRGLTQRDLADGDTWAIPSLEEVADLNLLGSSPFEVRSTSPELRNALYLIHMSNSLNVHTYGASSWNRFVFQYVPGQLVGYNVKNSLMIETDLSDLLQNDRGYVMSTGSTETGIGESYVEFGYFGCLIFLVTAIIVGRYYQWASTSPWGQTFYVVAIVPALLAITAYAAYFFVAFPLYFCFLTFLRYVVRPKLRRSALSFSGIR